KLNEYQATAKDWLFGYLSYDLKNDVENLTSNNVDGLHFPDLYFFQPKKLFLFYGGQVEIQYLNMVSHELEKDWHTITEMVLKPHETETRPLAINSRTSKENYIQKVDVLLEHIKRGDIYEANLCQEFYSENATINPYETFFRLNKISRPPFSVFLKLNEHFALSASPERYLKKTGNFLISQPIKGTARRMKNR